jgi:hypothetical protein
MHSFVSGAGSLPSTGKRTCRINWCIVTLCVLLLTGCSDDDNPVSGNQDNEIINNLVFQRQNASTIACGTDCTLCCGIWESGYIDKNTLKIMFYDTTMQAANWKLFILIDEAQEHSGYVLPTQPAGQSPVTMFVYDVSTGNEVNSEAEGSSGVITLNSFTCGPPVRADITMNAILGSEFFQGPAITVQGSFTCVVYENHSSIECDFAF